MSPLDNGMTITIFEDFGARGRYVWLNNYILPNIVGCNYLAMLYTRLRPWQQSSDLSAEIHRLHLGKPQLNRHLKCMVRYKGTTGTLGHRYNNKYMQLTHKIKRNNITTLVKRWPNVVDDSVGPTLAGRWPNGDVSPLGQRKGSWPKQRWANGWCQRWPNQCASVGPTLAQPNIAIWGWWTSKYLMMIIAKINRNLGTRASKYKVSIYTERQLVNSPSKLIIMQHFIWALF